MLFSPKEEKVYYAFSLLHNLDIYHFLVEKLSPE